MVECVAFFSRRDRRDMPKNRDVAVSAAVFKINSPGSTCQRLRATQKRLKNQLRRTKDLTKNGFNDISMTKKAGNKPKTRLFCLNVSMHNKPCNRCRSAKILTFLVVLVQNHQGLSSIGQQVSAEKGADKPPVVTGDPHLDSITIYIVHDRQVKSKMMIFLIWFLDPPCFFKSETRGYHQVSVRYLHVRWIMVRFPSLQVWWVCVILFAAEVCQAGSAWVFRSRRGGDKKTGAWIVCGLFDEMFPPVYPCVLQPGCMEFAIPGHNMSRRVTTIKSKASRRARREPGPVICHEGTGRNTAKRVGGHTISMVETQHTDWNAPSNKL